MVAEATSYGSGEATGTSFYLFPVKEDIEVVGSQGWEWRPLLPRCS